MESKCNTSDEMGERRSIGYRMGPLVNEVRLKLRIRGISRVQMDRVSGGVGICLKIVMTRVA